MNSQLPARRIAAIVTVAINARTRQTARLLARAAAMETEAETRRFDLQHAQTASWLLGHAEDQQPAVRDAYDKWQLAEHRAAIARQTADRALLHTASPIVVTRHGERPARRPVYSSTPGSATRTTAAALHHRRQTAVVVVGFVGAWPSTRPARRPAIFSGTWA